MENIKRKAEVKYILSYSSNEELQNYLSSPQNYNDFIEGLTSILLKERNYEFYIFERANQISEEIELRKKNEKNTLNEVFIKSHFRSFNELSISLKHDFKSQYAYIYTYKIGIPYTMRSDDISEYIKSNYYNILSFDAIINYDDQSLKEKLSGKFNTLVTINSVLYEEEEESIDDSWLGLFEELVEYPLNREDYKDNITYFKAKLYQNRTAKNISEFKKEKEEKIKKKMF